jgi:hypothetical protein
MSLPAAALSFRLFESEVVALLQSARIDSATAKLAATNTRNDDDPLHGHIRSRTAAGKEKASDFVRVRPVIAIQA